MTPTIVSSLVQTLPLFSNAKPNLSAPDEKGAGTSSADVTLTKDGPPAPVDIVSLSSQSRQAMTEVMKTEALLEDAKKEKAKQDEANIVNNGGNTDRAMAKVQFVYNMNGDLSIRYMDTANRLIYQTPSELMLRLKETATGSESSVDTKA